MNLIKMHLKKISSICCLAVITFFYLRNIISGFRWPSNYVMTNSIIDYSYGFLPRGLLGAIGKLIFENNWYSYKYLFTVILIIGFIFIFWLLGMIIRSGYNFNNPMLLSLLFCFSISPFVSYYMHEMGYYEQYGYVFIIFLLYFLQKNSVFKLYILPSLLGLISLLISETNMFLIIPIMFSFSAILIIHNEENIKKLLRKLSFLLITYIPHIIYCIYVSLCEVSAEDMLQMLNDHKEKVSNQLPYFNFNIREDVYYYICKGRIDTESWPIKLHPIYIWCVAMSLLIIVFITYLLYKKHICIRTIVAYDVLSVSVGVCSYLTCLLAWDLDRFYFCLFMSVFFVSIFTFKRLIKNIDFQKEFIPIIALMIVAFIGMSDDRFVLFDGVIYNDNLLLFANTLRERITFSSVLF